MVGLPFPNLKSPELIEKMDYLDKHHVSSCQDNNDHMWYLLLRATELWRVNHRDKYTMRICAWRQWINRLEEPSDTRVTTHPLCWLIGGGERGRGERERREWREGGEREGVERVSYLYFPSRYSSESIRAKLPRWIASQLLVTSGFGHMFGAMRQVTVCEEYACLYLTLSCICSSLHQRKRKLRILIYFNDTLKIIFTYLCQNDWVCTIIPILKQLTT